jgi:uncharacterized caspase-like protein
MFVRRILRITVVACVFFSGLSPGQAQEPERRIALVIGNSAYRNGPLATPANDAGLVAQTLQAAGFDVVGARDLDGATLRTAFREFLDKAQAAGPRTVALVYFAGHGLQVRGENYLAGVDARLATEGDVPFEVVRLADLTKPLASLSLKLRIVLVDAARANGVFAASQPAARGLALAPSEPGTLIGFNAAPGTIAPEGGPAYGAYATALSEMIKADALPLDELFGRVRVRVSELTQGAQLPWHVSRVEEPFLFFQRTGGAVPRPDRFAELQSRPVRDFDAEEAYLAALARDRLQDYQAFLTAYPDHPLASRVNAIIAARREAITWRRTTEVDTAEAYWSYLRRYPRGPHAAEARQRLTQIAAALEPPASFGEIAFDVEPPTENERADLEQPSGSAADPALGRRAPPPVPVAFLARRPAYFANLPQPRQTGRRYSLPIPVYHPVPAWLVRPAHVAPVPGNYIVVNIHNRVVINPANGTVVVTNPAGRRVQPLSPQLIRRLETGGATPILRRPELRHLSAKDYAFAILTVTTPAAVARPGAGMAGRASEGAAAGGVVPGVSAPRQRQAVVPQQRQGPSERQEAARLRQELDAARRAAEDADAELERVLEQAKRDAEAAERDADDARRRARDHAQAERTRRESSEVIARQHHAQAIDAARNRRRQAELAAESALQERYRAAREQVRQLERGSEPGGELQRARDEELRARQALEDWQRQIAQRASGAAPRGDHGAAGRARETEQREREAAQQRERDAAQQREREADRQREAEAAQQRDRDAAQQRERAATQQREREAGQQRDREAAQRRERETSQQREREATQQREREAAQRKEREATQQRDREAAQQRDRETAQRREREAAQQRDREATQRREHEASQQRDREAAQRREREASQQRDREAAQRREREASQQRDREAAQQREREASQRREREASQQRDREAAQQREREASQRREREASQQREREAAQQREREAAQRREREASQQREREAAQQREREAAQRREREASQQREREAAQQREREAAQRREREAAQQREREAAQQREREATQRREREAAEQREREAAQRREREAAEQRAREQQRR